MAQETMIWNVREMAQRTGTTTGQIGPPVVHLGLGLVLNPFPAIEALGDQDASGSCR
jgi:hypothetical protein